MWRRILVIVAALVVLVFAAAAALLTFVDVNRFKPQIEQAAQERLHRRLTIDGDLALSVFPRLAVILPHTTLSERDGKGTLLSLDAARVSVALWPLLRGRVQVDRVRIDGLKARLHRAADGSTNIDDLLRPDQAAPSDGKGADARPADAEIAGIELTHGKVSLTEPSGTMTLTGLQLNTGRVAPGARLPISASTQFAVPHSKASGAVRLTATASFDPDRRAYGAEAIEINIKGRLGTEDVEVGLKAPRLAIDADSIRGDAIAATFRRSGADAAEITLDIGAFSGTMKSLQTEKAGLTAHLKHRASSIGISLSGPAQTNLDARTITIPKLAGAMTIDDPTPVVKSMKLALAGSVLLDARKQSLGLRADMRFEDTTLSAKLDVGDFSTPRVAFDVRADQFNLDRYATPAPGSAPGQKSPAASAEARIDLSMLRALNAHGQIRIGQFQARGIKASDVRASMRAAGGRAEIAPISAQLYGGFLNGSARVSTEGNRVGLDATLTDVAVGPLLKDAMQKDPIEGRGSVKVALSSAGTMVSAMKRGLDGTASIQVRDGAIRGIDLAQKLRNARALILGGRSEAQRANSAERTDFSELSASFRINSGVATSDDLDLKSPLLRVGGAGRIDLGASTIDYTARVAVVGSVTGQDGRALTDLRGVTVPVRLSGPFDQLSYSIDWGGVARETLKSRLADDVKRRLAPQTEEKRPKLEERARDVLKGLFGR